MNRIDALFRKKKKNILSVYFTAGFPELDSTQLIINELHKNGADLIEIGIPFSDPLADGPTIQRSSEIALNNGMCVELLFSQLKDIRIICPDIPLLLMGYLNPILQYGVGKFCETAASVGIDGFIIPDLPLDEYLEKYKSTVEEHGLKNIFLITPQTSEKRIREIDMYSTGFIYMVALASTTGASESMTDQQEDYFKRINDMKLNNPVMVGFGISSNKTFKKACEYSNGAIIGSAFINAISGSTGLKKSISLFTETILSETI